MKNNYVYSAFGQSCMSDIIKHIQLKSIEWYYDWEKDEFDNQKVTVKTKSQLMLHEFKNLTMKELIKGILNKK